MRNSQLEEKSQWEFTTKKKKKVKKNHALEQLKEQIFMLCPVYYRQNLVRGAVPQ